MIVSHFCISQGGNTLHIDPEIRWTRSKVKTCLSPLQRRTICSGSPRCQAYP